MYMSEHAMKAQEIILLHATVTIIMRQDDVPQSKQAEATNVPQERERCLHASECSAQQMNPTNPILHNLAIRLQRLATHTALEESKVVQCTFL